MLSELLKGLTEEQRQKVKECKSVEEVLELAKAEGVSLTDEQLEAVSGGECKGTEKNCEVCNSTKLYVWRIIGGGRTYECLECGHEWTEFE